MLVTEKLKFKLRGVCCDLKIWWNNYRSIQRI